MGKKDKNEMSEQKKSFLDGTKKEELVEKKQMKFLIKSLLSLDMVLTNHMQLLML